MTCASHLITVSLFCIGYQYYNCTKILHQTFESKRSLAASLKGIWKITLYWPVRSKTICNTPDISPLLWIGLSLLILWGVYSKNYEKQQCMFSQIPKKWGTNDFDLATQLLHVSQTSRTISISLMWWRHFPHLSNTCKSI